MGTTYKGIYLPDVDETGWGTLVNANWTLLADAHVTARSFYLPIMESIGGSGQANVGGTFPSAVPGQSLTDGGTVGAYWSFMMPQDTSTATILVRPVWVPSLTDASAHSVRWSMDLKVLVSQDVSTAGTVVSWTGTAAARTNNIVVLENGQASTGVSPAAGNIVRFNLSRVGGDAADTYVGTVHLLGVRIDYTAV